MLIFFLVVECVFVIEYFAIEDEDSLKVASVLEEKHIVVFQLLLLQPPSSQVIDTHHAVSSLLIHKIAHRLVHVYVSYNAFLFKHVENVVEFLVFFFNFTAFKPCFQHLF